MRKRIWMPVVLVVVVLAVLFVPIPQASYDDGGTREYVALTYKIVDWNRLTDVGDNGVGLYENVRFYGFSDRNTSIDELWKRETAVFNEQVEVCTEAWIEKSDRTKCAEDLIGHIRITAVGENCFFAEPVIPFDCEIKLNGELSAEWCIGDQAFVTYENLYYDEQTKRMEADVLNIEPSDYAPEEMVYYKPVIYLYPEQDTEVSVELTLEGEFICTYPKYRNGWQVTASPGGTLTDERGQIYNYLYWEGTTYAEYDLSEGFCVKGEDTAAFLEKALAELGLNRREANECIVFWLPLMENNPYNIIAFQTDTYTNAAGLNVTPAPDTVIRVFMTWQAAEEYVELEEQTLTAPERCGFTVVEWGGTEIK